MSRRLPISLIAASALAAAAVGAGAFARSSVVGDLTPLACIGNAGQTSTCASSANLSIAFSVASTPSGGNVYVAANGANAVEEFARGADGKLAHAGCIADATNGPGNCDRAPGLLNPTGVTVSPDGKTVYVAATGSNALGVFNRNVDGTLTAAGCIGAVGANPANCATTANLKRVVSVAVSPDGKSVYAAASDSNAIETFVRSGSGALTPNGCLGNPGNVSTGPANCNGVNGLDAPQDLVVSPDGKNVYVAGPHALVILNRDPSNGALTDGGCIGASAAAGCGRTGDVTSGQGVVVSPDGKNVYEASFSGLTTFARDTNGGLSEIKCFGDAASAPPGCTGVAGLHVPEGVAVSPDGASVYTTSAGSNDVKVFTRAADGSLGSSDCIGQNGSDRPNCSPNAALTAGMKLVVAPDGKNVYATVGGTLQEFARETTPSAPSPSTTTATTTTPRKQTTSTLNVRLVFATVVQTKGGHDVLTIRVRVARPADAVVKLFGRHSSVLLQQTFSLKGGGNTISAPLGPSVATGTHQLSIALRDATGNHKTLTATVLVPK